MKVPPVAVALALASMLLAILAAAQPLVRGVGQAEGLRITVVVDRGIKMSARDGQTIRFRAAADAAQGLCAIPAKASERWFCSRCREN